MTYKIVRTKRAKLPGLEIPREVWEKVGLVAEGAILENIAKQKRADGGGIKRNARSTSAQKIRKGWLWNGRVMSLVAEKRRLVKGKQKSFRFRVHRKSVSIAPVGNMRKRIVRWVQQKGYVGWFDLSKRHMKAVRVVFREWIKSSFDKAASK